MANNNKKVLIGVTGSVAAIKVPELVQQLQQVSSEKVKDKTSSIHSLTSLEFQPPLCLEGRELEVQVVATRCSLHFFDRSSLPVKCHVDEEEWEWKEKGDPVLHIELRKWADILVIAPLDANTMAKMATGICDNLLTCVVRAWDPAKPLLYCPAMNTFMWEHPLTASQITTLTQQFGYIQVPPVSKTLACGDKGVGAMAHVEDIVKAILENLRTSV